MYYSGREKEQRKLNFSRRKWRPLTNLCPTGVGFGVAGGDKWLLNAISLKKKKVSDFMRENRMVSERGRNSEEREREERRHCLITRRQRIFHVAADKPKAPPFLFLKELFLKNSSLIYLGLKFDEEELVFDRRDKQMSARSTIFLLIFLFERYFYVLKVIQQNSYIYMWCVIVT